MALRSARHIGYRYIIHICVVVKYKFFLLIVEKKLKGLSIIFKYR